MAANDASGANNTSGANYSNGTTSARGAAAARPSTPRRGPMGPGAATRPAERPRDLAGTIGKLFGYLGEHRVALVLGIAFAIGSVVFNIVGPKVLGQVTTKLYEGLVAKVQGTGDVDFAWIGRTLVVLLGIYLASSACNLVQGWLMTGVTQRVVFRMRREISEKIARVPMSYFSGHSKGDVLSRITNDVDTLGQSLNQSITQLVTSVTQVVGVTVMMLTISAPLTLTVMVTLPVSVAIVAVVVRFSQRYFREQQQVLGRVNGIVEEDFAGQEVIQVFDRADASVEEFERENDRLFESGWRSQFLSGLMMPLMTLVGNAGYVGVVVVGAALAAGGAATPGDIQSFIQYVRNFTQPIQQLANVSNTLQSMAAVTERVFEFLAAPEETGPATPRLPAVREGRVEFEHVRFGYEPDKPVIRDFTFCAEPAKTVAIVGPTGAGKTTLVKLVQRFWDVDAGAIRVDGVDVRDWGLDELRAQFAMVLQDTWLFNGTIRENIRYGRPDATDEEVETAARTARCDHFIHTLAGGYDFEINEEGTNLSQGQRQLVTIARAVLADRPCLILDEATSNVDTRTEELIQRAMDGLMAGRTSFVIAHRLSTIKAADTILVLRDGDIVEQGTHEELLAAGGFYAELYESQFQE